MAFPRFEDPTVPANSETPSLGASRIREKTQDLIDLLNLPTATNISEPLTINRLGPLTNKTGVGLVAGDVVALSAADDQAVVLADTQTALLPFVVALATIANNQPGVFGQVGQATVTVQGAVVRGNYLRKSATTKALEDTGIAQGAAVALPAGALGVALTGAAGPGAGTCRAFLFGLTPTVPTQVGSYQVRGLVGGNNAVTPNTKFDLAADLVQLRNPTSGAISVFTNTGTLTNDTGNDNTVANGRDQLAAFGASNWIHFYFVRTTGGVLRTRSSLTAPPTGPTLPAGEDSWAYAGAVRYDVTPLLVRTRFRGTSATYDGVQTALSNGLAAVETAVSLSSFVPPNALRYQVLLTMANSSGIICRLRLVSGTDWLVDPPAGGFTGINIHATPAIPNVGQQFFYLFDSAPTNGLFAYVMSYYLPNGGE